MLGILSETRSRRAFLYRAERKVDLALLDQRIVDAVLCLQCGAEPGTGCHVGGSLLWPCDPHLVRQQSYDPHLKAAA